MANTDNTLCLGLFQVALGDFFDTHDIRGFTVMITLSMFIKMMSMKWDAVSVDSTTTGWIGHHNLFDPWDKEADNDLNTQAMLLMGAKTSAPDHNTQVILKMVVILPVGDDLIDHLRRLKIAVLVCLPAGRGFLAWVRPTSINSRASALRGEVLRFKNPHPST